MKSNYFKAKFFILHIDKEEAMQLKRDTEYAMRIMVYIAEHLKQSGKRTGTPSSTVIANTGIPMVTSNRICSRLEDTGMIRKEISKDGEKWLYPGNGFWEQSILSIGEAVEGNMKIFVIFDKNSSLSQSYGKKLQETQNSLDYILSKTTLESIVADC